MPRRGPPQVSNAFQPSTRVAQPPDGLTEAERLRILAKSETQITLEVPVTDTECDD